MISLQFCFHFNRRIADSMPTSELSYSKSSMVINRTKQLAFKVRSPPDRKAQEAKMKDAIAARHGTKRPAVGGVTQRARIKTRKRGSRGKTTGKANTESDVSGDNDSDTETYILILCATSTATAMSASTAMMYRYRGRKCQIFLRRWTGACTKHKIFPGA
jgi:hypothetical protein